MYCHGGRVVGLDPMEKVRKDKIYQIIRGDGDKMFSVTSFLSIMSLVSVLFMEKERENVHIQVYL